MNLAKSRVDSLLRRTGPMTMGVLFLISHWASFFNRQVCRAACR